GEGLFPVTIVDLFFTLHPFGVIDRSEAKPRGQSAAPLQAQLIPAEKTGHPGCRQPGLCTLLPGIEQSALIRQAGCAENQTTTRSGMAVICGQRITRQIHLPLRREHPAYAQEPDPLASDHVWITPTRKGSIGA